MTEWMDQYGAEVGKVGGRIMGWYRGPNPALWYGLVAKLEYKS